MEDIQAKRIIEALLFVSALPLSLKRLTEIILNACLRSGQSVRQITESE